MPRKVINPKSTGTLRVATSQAALTTGDAQDTAITEQVTSFRVVPQANLADVPATFSDPAGQSAAASSWQVEVSYLQDWGKTDGMSKFLYDNDGVLMWFRFDPAGTTEDGFEGPCYLTAGAYGGAADGNWVDDLVFPCAAKPTRLNPA
jgi:hypothetical protein